jgi:transposase-like protein
VLIDISSATLRKMVKLSERKEALLSQIQELDRQMAALQQPAEEGSAFVRVQPLKRTSARGTKGRMERGALKAKIIAALRAAGQGGMTIRELSDQLGIKPANLYVWFNGTGRKTKGIKKIGPAKYRL